jgi:hypothetical protein
MMEQEIFLRLLLLLCFGLLGYGYEKSGTRRAIGRLRPFGFTLTLAAIIFLIMTGLFGIEGNLFLLLPLAAASCFLLPSLIRLTWLAYDAIPESTYPIWISAPEELVPAAVPSGPAIELHFDVTIPPESPAGLMLFTALPVNEALGQAFVGALLRHNEQFPGTAVALADGQGHPFGWQFYEVQLKGVRKNFIDPKTVLGTPSLKQGTHILVKRCHSQRPVIYRMKAR